MGGQSDQKHEESCACGLGVGPCPEHSDPADEDRPTQKAAGITPTTEWTKPPPILPKKWTPREIVYTKPFDPDTINNRRRAAIPDSAVRRLKSRNKTDFRALVPSSRKADYRVRNEICARLGYKTYGEYLKSKRWLDIRARVLARDNRTCYLCGKDATMCHHASYTLAAMLGSDIDSIFSVCHGCHQNTHFDSNGRTIDLFASGDKMGVTFTGQENLPDQIGRERKCPGTMKSGDPCSLKADRRRGTVWYCHLHDPDGKFKKNLSRPRGGGGHVSQT